MKSIHTILLETKVKSLDKNQHSFMIIIEKMLSILEIIGNFPNMIKSISVNL